MESNTNQLIKMMNSILFIQRELCLQYFNKWDKQKRI